MAENTQTPEAAAQKSQASKRMMWLVVVVLLIALSLPTVLLVVFGMLPSIVAAIVDRTPQKSATFCVGGMNFCGVFPYLLTLWGGDHTIAMAFDTLTDVFALLVMYGAAGFGWMIFTSVPPIIVTFLNVRNQRRVATLRATQKRIIAEWGNDVSTPLDAEETGKATPPAKPSEPTAPA
jgi:hypothetical protein